MVNLSFYIFDIIEFELLIGQPIERLIHEGQKGNLNVKFRKTLNLTLPITHSINGEAELNPEQDPMDEVMVASFLNQPNPILKKMPSISFRKKMKNLKDQNHWMKLLSHQNLPLSLNPFLLALNMHF